ncbi:hypothetical protein [Vibrio phage VpKK5]|uniref:hypothetical protein n=1 Tax=Vibrio phage VpKK5 TaxID=1538804 RepID=UPI0004F683CC|nr:hypothetical protein VC55_gp77 [Vibrio phage VpKK5]AIM40580.1 hypothetical protein [Vibrio phage VpKK5]
MKIQVKPQMVYIVSDDQGVPIGEFKQHGDEWNGMVELRDSKGSKIICEKPHALDTELFGGMFEGIFGKGKEDPTQELQVVTIAPSLASMLATRKEVEDDRD